VWSASRPCRLYPRERPGTHCTEGWVGPGGGLDRYGKSRPTGFRSPDLPARSESLYRLRYPDSIKKGWLTICKETVRFYSEKQCRPIIYCVGLTLYSLILKWHKQLILKIHGVVMGIKIKFFKRRGIYCPAQWSPIFVHWVRYIQRCFFLLLPHLGLSRTEPCITGGVTFRCTATPCVMGLSVNTL
jgi:hypothetical protein